MHAAACLLKCMNTFHLGLPFAINTGDCFGFFYFYFLLLILSLVHFHFVNSIQDDLITPKKTNDSHVSMCVDKIHFYFIFRLSIISQFIFARSRSNRANVYVCVCVLCRVLATVCYLCCRQFFMRFYVSFLCFLLNRVFFFISLKQHLNWRKSTKKRVKR